MLLAWVPILLLVLQTGRACTSIIVAPDEYVTAGQGTLITHSADCRTCDFRLGKVEGSSWAPGDVRPVFEYRESYPHLVTSARGETWKLSNLEKDLPQNFTETTPMAQIPQVPETHGVLEGIYGIASEQGIGIGESTVAAALTAKPLSAGGKAMFDISALTKVCLERATTARECILIIGQLATAYGFYGAEDSIGEAGEALTIGDGKEAWVMHILADDTGASAVWCAQRVPKGHIAVLANQFIIREVIASSDDFKYSTNLWDVAERAGLWQPGQGENLDFAKTFQPLSTYSDVLSTRRRWRVFSSASGTFASGASPFTSSWDDDYPFSIACERPIGVKDLLALNRDHYEGTMFDTSAGLTSGPYGDPARPATGASLDGSVSKAESRAEVHLERPIAGSQNSYRITYYHASTGTVVPVYVSSRSLPEPMTVGSLFKYTPRSLFWASMAAGNYAKNWYKYTLEEFRHIQGEVERKLFADQAGLEEQVKAQLHASPGDDGHEAAVQILTDYSASVAEDVLEQYNRLLHTFFARYHDGLYIDHLDAPKFDYETIYYPKWWLEAVGRWGVSAEDAALNQSSLEELSKNSELSGGIEGSSDSSAIADLGGGAEGLYEEAPRQPVAQASYPSAGNLTLLLLTVASATACGAMGFLLGARWNQKRASYVSL